MDLCRMSCENGDWTGYVAVVEMDDASCPLCNGNLEEV
jgi:hypothetical protein